MRDGHALIDRGRGQTLALHEGARERGAIEAGDVRGEVPRHLLDEGGLVASRELGHDQLGPYEIRDLHAIRAVTIPPPTALSASRT